MNNVFAVVGEHRTQPDRLLLLGEDGRYYAYAADGQLTPIVPTDHWRLDDEREHRGRSRGEQTVKDGPSRRPKLAQFIGSKRGAGHPAPGPKSRADPNRSLRD